MSGDDRSWADRDKLTFSELDRRRRERGSSGEREPRSKAAQERADAAKKQYMKEIDGLFAKGSKAEIERLTTAMRDAHGTPALADACRAYQQAAGFPEEPSIISLFLDTGETDMILVGLEALKVGHERETLKITASLRSQLRILSDHSDDEIAETAEELLQAL